MSKKGKKFANYEGGEAHKSWKNDNFYEFWESQNNDDFWVLEILFSEICIWWLWIEMNVQDIVG